MEEIFKRRSIRIFKDLPVSEDLIRKVLAAGMAAPSAGNEQPWQFIVVRDKLSLKKLGDCGPYARAAAGAGAAIVVCGDLSLEKHEGFWVQDCSAAIQNMLLEVTSLGLGSVWLGVYPLDERVSYLRKFFSLPEQVIPFAIIPIGFPGQQLPAVDRYSDSRVHREKW